MTLRSGGDLPEPAYVPGAADGAVSGGSGSKYGPGVLGPEHLQAHYDYMKARFGTSRVIGGQMVGAAVT